MYDFPSGWHVKNCSPAPDSGSFCQEIQQLKQEPHPQGFIFKDQQFNITKPQGGMFF